MTRAFFALIVLFLTSVMLTAVALYQAFGWWGLGAMLGITLLASATCWAELRRVRREMELVNGLWWTQDEPRHVTARRYWERRG